MELRNTTIIILIVYFAIQFIMFIALCVYDAYAYMKAGNHPTITFVMKDFLKGWPIFGILFGLIFGMIIGHIAWQVGGGENPIVVTGKKLGLIKTSIKGNINGQEKE